MRDNNSSLKINKLPIYQKIVQNYGEKELSPQGFDYTFQPNKDDGKVQKPQGLQQLENLKFSDPYSNLNTPNLVSQDQPNESNNMFEGIVSIKRRGEKDQKTLKYSASCQDNNIIIPGLDKSNFQNRHTASRDLTQRENREIWQKSYDLLTKLSTERTSELYKRKNDAFSVNSWFEKDSKARLTNYEDEPAYSGRKGQNSSRSSQYDKDLFYQVSSRSNPVIELISDKKRTRNKKEELRKR